MTLTLLTGGARSGKSRLALALAARTGEPVAFVATGEAGDDEMAGRIARHRRERPAGWTTIEEPLALEEAIARAGPDACVIVDCLALWVANALGAGAADTEVLDRAHAAAARAAERPGVTIAVTNEVGLGVVPATPLGRAYRDLLGAVNAAWSCAADEAYLVVAGRPLALGPPLADWPAWTGP
jgi:adenosyl cobinamide kinase/adenosyl cobinamide phosphate guanylyltransferase